MTTKRGNEFPATSIGRTASTRIQNADSGLEAHPLLSPRPASPAPSEHGSITGSSASANNLPPRYLPYTPRQRVTATAATTGTTVHPPPQHLSGDATSKLQLMQLKAAAQIIGLDSGTLGWAMLEKLVLDVEVSDELTEIWNVITSGKATLLLPLESAFTNEKITADFMKDHITFCVSASRIDAPLITLSGLRGTLDNEILTFRSTIDPTSKLFHELLNPITRATRLSHLPPLPTPFSDIAPISYPQFRIPSHTSSLHLPPRSYLPSKPPLPPRPGARPHTTPSSTPRISNPFASLFGGAKAAPQPPPHSPPVSLRSFDSINDTNSPAKIAVFTLDRRIVRKDVGKEINKTIRAELEAALRESTKHGSVAVPSWITERIHDLTIDWYPFIKARSHSSANRNISTEKSTKDLGRKGYVVNSIEGSLEDLAELIQDFFASLEQDMRLAGEPFSWKRKERGSDSEAEGEFEREKWEQDKLESEGKIREVMEMVERMITWLFYDRLFKQPTTDDASHDEALSNRIAALNLLDLGLGHLGIDVGDVDESDLHVVVKACGDMLYQLDSCRSPADKAACLVAAHKIVVDGLSRLPPIRLISEDEVDANHQNDVPQTAKPLPSTQKTVSSNRTDHSAEIPSTSVLLTPTVEPISIPALELNDEVSIEKAAPVQSYLSAETRVKPAPPPLNLDIQLPSAKKEPTPVSGDVLFPIMIFSVVKANPPHLVSNLLFTQRFRNQSIGGEESYCLINLMAVAEFLENVDMAALGLDNSDKVLSTADLTPIPLSRSPISAETPLAPADGAVGGLRGRVEQQVDAIADSANKVISGVVDSSFGILRSFMPNGAHPQAAGSASSGRTTPSTPGPSKASFGLLRRESGFSIASLAASLPIAGRSRSAAGNAEEAGQQMISVSKPASLKSNRSALKIRMGGGGEEQENASDDDDDDDDGDDPESVSSDEESEEEGVVQDAAESGKNLSGEVRSIRSFESMLSMSREKKKGLGAPRKSLSDRLASMSALAASSIKGSSPPGSRRSSSSLVPHQRSKSAPSPVSSRPASPAQVLSPVQVLSPKLQLAPPKQRFIECAPDDLRLSEIGELLCDYRRLVEGIRAVGGFDE